MTADDYICKYTVLGKTSDPLFILSRFEERFVFIPMDEKVEKKTTLIQRFKARETFKELKEVAKWSFLNFLSLVEEIEKNNFYNDRSGPMNILLTMKYLPHLACSTLQFKSSESLHPSNIKIENQSG